MRVCKLFYIDTQNRNDSAHSVLLANNLAVNGSHEQLTKFMPRVCDGSTIGGMCMSEPGAGTDVLGMRTR